MKRVFKIFLLLFLGFTVLFSFLKESHANREMFWFISADKPIESPSNLVTKIKEKNTAIAVISCHNNESVACENCNVGIDAGNLISATGGKFYLKTEKGEEVKYCWDSSGETCVKNRTVESWIAIRIPNIPPGETLKIRVYKAQSNSASEGWEVLTLYDDFRNGDFTNNWAGITISTVGPYSYIEELPYSKYAVRALAAYYSTGQCGSASMSITSKEKLTGRVVLKGKLIWYYPGGFSQVYFGSRLFLSGSGGSSWRGHEFTLNHVGTLNNEKLKFYFGTSSVCYTTYGGVYLDLVRVDERMNISCTVTMR